MTINYDVKEKNKNLKQGFRIFPAVVTYQKDGKQKRKVFQNKTQAKLFHDNMVAKTKNLGKAFWDLKPADADLACRALQRSKDNGYDLMTALAFYEAQTKASANAMIDNIVEKIIALKNTSLNTKKYKLNFEREMERFAKAHNGWYMDTFKTEDIENYVNDPEKGWSLTTKEYNKRLFSVFFNMAKDLKYTLNNPVKFLNKKQYKKANPTYIEFFTPNDARQILRAAAAGRPEYVVPLVLTLFNGPRIDTSCRMIADDIHMDYDAIVIPDAIDKSFGRTVDMLPNTKAWLKEFLPKAKLPVFGGDIVPAKLASENHAKFTEWCMDVQNSWAAVRTYVCRHAKAAGGRWPKNGHRHAFCTYYLATSGDQQRTAFFAGNTPKMIQEHYDGKLFKKDIAKEWFDITPENTL